MTMRALVIACLCLTVSSAAASAQPKGDRAEGSEKPRKESKRPVTAPRLGVTTPGVRIPFSEIKAEAELPMAPAWVAFTDSVLAPDLSKDTIERINAKTNKPGDSIGGLHKPCGGAVSAFGSLWIPNCGDGTVARVDPKTAKITATVASGVGTELPSVAASADSVWVLSDDKTTLSRIDPQQNQVVAELRLPAGCNSLTFGESALWVTCPTEGRVLRVDPLANLVDKRIEVSAQPRALAIGESSVWVLCQKEGKVERIDPKTFKVSKTILLEVPGAEGGIVIGQGSVWVTLAGFPLTRIDPGTDKVVQQFYGEGGGAIQFGLNSIWLANLKEKTFWRLDPKRIAATLAE
jgi:virginiamycin B lyase